MSGVHLQYSKRQDIIDGVTPSVFVVLIFNVYDLRYVQTAVVFANADSAMGWTADKEMKEKHLREGDYFAITQVEYRSHQ